MSVFQGVIDWLVIFGYLAAVIGSLVACKVVRRFKNPLKAPPKHIADLGQQMSASLTSATLSDRFPAPKE